MSRKSDYFEKLKRPEWQKKRLEILTRDQWKCTECFDGESMLHVHHLYYIKGREPWNYPGWSLRSLCEKCHKRIQDMDCDEFSEFERFLELILDEGTSLYCLVMEADLCRERGTHVKDMFLTVFSSLCNANKEHGVNCLKMPHRGIYDGPASHDEDFDGPIKVNETLSICGRCHDPI